jgi:hypothetical protein
MPITKKTWLISGIIDVEVFGEPKMLLSKQLKKKCRSRLV